jgi:hypothetical protein
MTTADITGTLGVGLILLAYFMNIFSFFPKEGKLFFLMNIFGAGLACLASFLIHYWPFVILEGVWTLVSVAGLIRKP